MKWLTSRTFWTAIVPPLICALILAMCTSLARSVNTTISNANSVPQITKQIQALTTDINKVTEALNKEVNARTEGDTKLLGELGDIKTKAGAAAATSQTILDMLQRGK